MKKESFKEILEYWRKYGAPGILRQGFISSEKNIKKHLDKREKILEKHEQGKLESHYYSRNKETGKYYLSPKKLWQEGA
ncbi:MAG: hypothetical protein AB1414_01105 [bacterium]